MKKNHYKMHSSEQLQLLTYSIATPKTYFVLSSLGLENILEIIS